MKKLEEKKKILQPIIEYNNSPIKININISLKEKVPISIDSLQNLLTLYDEVKKTFQQKNLKNSKSVQTEIDISQNSEILKTLEIFKSQKQMPSLYFPKLDNLKNEENFQTDFFDKEKIGIDFGNSKNNFSGKINEFIRKVDYESGLKKKAKDLFFFWNKNKKSVPFVFKRKFLIQSDSQSFQEFIDFSNKKILHDERNCEFPFI